MLPRNHPIVRPRPEGISLFQIRKWSDGRLARLAGRGRLALHKHFGNPRRTEVRRTEIRSQPRNQPTVSTFRINLFVVLVIFITAASRRFAVDPPHIGWRTVPPG